MIRYSCSSRAMGVCFHLFCDAVIFSDQTGTGKTLAFLLPVIHRLREIIDADDTPVR